ncbi:MAG: hypothetical protein H6660_01820 [Ardenticatenaceae bacterium]|nr:hypothetical protein [Ardenticatenaceae bacterium]
MRLKQFLQTTLNPAWYHGHTHKAPFFEGWYYKLVDASGHHRFAIIPGIFLSRTPHAFVQVLDGRSGSAYYHEFKERCFWAAKDRFEVHIGANRFSQTQLNLYIERPRQTIEGELHFHQTTPWPSALTSPGMMGWYAWVPTMECYHGVVSLDHAITGTLTIDGETIDFSGGRGYIEKDWGQSFPAAWIWLQSNHFETQGTCLTGSTAIIPWRRSAFRGFTVGLWHEKQLYRFATYTGAKTAHLQVSDDTVEWVLRDKKRELHIVAAQGAQSEFGLLKGPDRVEMGKRVAETLTAVLHIQLNDISNGQTRLIFEGNGRYAGLEVHNASQLLGMG